MKKSIIFSTILALALVGTASAQNNKMTMPIAPGVATPNKV